MKKRITLIFLFFTLINFKSFALTELYRLTYRDDPATTITIGWVGDSATVYYGTVDNGINETLYPLQKNVDRTTNHKGMTTHFVRLTNLSPKKVYYFVLKDKTGTKSQRFSFMTMSDNANDQISFVNGGDTRDATVQGIENCNCRYDRQQGFKVIQKVRPDFVVFTGDFVVNYPIISNENVDWRNWFADWQQTISPDGRMIPIVTAKGNHDDFIESKDLSNFLDINTTNYYYSLTFGSNLLKIYFLNSDNDNVCSDATGLNWLKTSLLNDSIPSNKKYWKFACYHHPIVPHADNGDVVNKHYQANCWVPLFEKYDVNLIMESHTHSMKTTFPLVLDTTSGNEKMFKRNDSLGVVYIGEGNFSAPQRTLRAKNSWTREADNIRSFFYITVNKEKTEKRTVMFNNPQNITQNTDNIQGSSLPEGITLYDEFVGANNGAILKLENPSITTAIKNNYNKNTFKLFPSIASTKINIELSKEIKNDNFLVFVFDALGVQQNITTNKISKRNFTIDISKMENGVGFVQIKDGENLYSRKFLKQ